VENVLKNMFECFCQGRFPTVGALTSKAIFGTGSKVGDRILVFYKIIF
jgi:hypothetical protein